MQATKRAGERKPVSALFVDIVGSTSLAETLDPEEWTDIVNGAFEALSQPVHRYEGTVAQLLGDGMLVVFGAPIAHEDDPERAVAAALDMIAAIEAYSASLGRSHGIVLAVRIGVNTGPVVVGNVGSDLRLEYTAIGDTMNVAARLQAAAEPGTVRITAATQRLVAHAFELRDVGALTLKGKAEPVQAYQVVGRRADRVSPRGLPGFASPLIGRDRELDALRARYAAVGPSNGGAVSIVGEPGIGKSRLLEEFRRSLPERSGGGWIEAQGLSYGRGLPYHLVIGLVESLAEVRPGADPATVAGALQRIVPAGIDSSRGVDDGSPGVPAAAFLAHLLSALPDPPIRERIERLDREMLQAHYVEALGAALIRVGERGTWVVVVEDIHWADESSITCLTRLLPGLVDTPVLLVLTSRPDADTAGWSLVQVVRETYGEQSLDLALAGLSEDESRELVARLLEIESLPKTVRAAILARSEGNPFFVEEVVRMLIDRGLVVRKGAHWVATGAVETAGIPATLHGLLLARIDQLPDEARRALRVASVVGRQFRTRVLRAVLDGSAAVNGNALAADGAELPNAALASTLGILETAGLVVLGATEPEPEYAFRHALVQDAAYDSILRRERADLHRSVAGALERLYPDRLDEMAADLVRHLEAAGELEAAAEWAFRAARQAERHSAMPEARALFDRAAAWLPDGPASARRRIEIGLGQARTGLYFKSFAEEIKRLQSLVMSAEELGDAGLLVGLYGALAHALQVRGNQYGASPELRHAVDRSVELGKALGDDPVRARPLLAQGVARLMAGSFEEAADLLGQAVPLLDASDELLWAFEAASNHAWALVRLGRFEEAEEAASRAVALARRSGSPTAQIDVKSTIAILRQEREQFDEALTIAREAAEEGEEKRIFACAAFGHLIAGEVCLSRGDAASAARSLNRATRLARLTNAFFIENLGRASLNAARWRSGDHAAALKGWAAALEAARASADPYGEAEVLWRRGAALAEEDVTRTDGIADLEAAGGIFARLGAKPALARAMLDLTAAYDRAGRTSEAAATSTTAADLRQQLGMRRQGSSETAQA